ncbi:MAG TPA: hypothetical protein VG323_07795, partial [Thermoanaerobaculia bacterium]|nr:hypothetical protein [Thermoanaerobaculia bacterium]
MLLRVAAAAWGFAVAIALLPHWTRPAQPGQLPGFATSIGLDANAPMHFIAGLMILPVVFAFLGRYLPARPLAIVSMFASLWLVLVDQNLAWTLAVPIVGIFLPDPKLTRRDVILIPTTLTVFLALLDVMPLSVEKEFLIAVACVLTVRLAVGYFCPLPSAFCFLFSPLALVLQTFFLGKKAHLGWPSLVIALGTPFLVRIKNERRAAAILAFVIYPIASYAYLTSTNLLVPEGKPRVNFFEDAHGIVPAGEMLRGERPYRDIIPAHGFVEDGLLDYVAMRARGATVGNALRTRVVFGSLNAVGVYALAAAATGSAEGGFLGFFLAALLGTIPTTSRVVPQLFTLALIAAAVRLRRPSLFVAAGFGAVVSLLTSLDFGVYTTLALIVAIVRFRPGPLRALRNAAVGVACAAVPLFVVFAFLGIAKSFVTTTLFEVLTLGPVSTMQPFTAPAAFKTWRFFPEVLIPFFDRGATMYVVWACAAIFAAVALTMRARRRIEPLLLIAVWIVAGGMSYAARHHLHFQFAVAPLLAAAAWTLYRLRSRYAMLAFLALLMLGQFTVHLIVDGWVRTAEGPLEPSLVTIDDLPRARGAWFSRDDARTVATARKFVAQSLGPVETFVDFTNRPMLYFLLERDCPLRQLGPSWYEPEERQRQVIAAIDGNPAVRAALVPNGIADGTGLDNVPNQTRAPLVWQYLLTHFAPQFEENGMVWWHRKPAVTPSVSE